MTPSKFTTGDRVSYNVGSDIYAATVVRTTPARVVVQSEWGDEITFTKRATGYFVYQGRTSGTLRHGGETRLDPHF
jgi:hypothetical protein